MTGSNLSMNQFAITPVVGEVDLQGLGSNIVSARVDNAQASPLVQGQAVKLATTQGGVPSVVARTSNNDPIFGFVTFNLKDINYPANSKLEIALFGSVIFLNSGGAITRGNPVEIDNATNNVIAYAGINPVAGFAYDGTTGSNQITRVYIQKPGDNASGGLKTIVVAATLAEINAGKVLIPGAAGKSIIVTNYIARVLGAFTTGTSVELESTNGTPVAVTTIAEAGLTNGAVLTPASANTTIGAGFGAALGAGDGVQVVNNGSAQAGGTSITFTISYLQQ